MAAGISVAIGLGATACSRDYVADYVYTVSASGPNINAFAVDYQSGILTQVTGSPFQTGFKRETTLTPSPDGKFLYVLSGPEDSAVEAFAVGTDGKLYGQKTYTLGGGTYPTSMAIDSAGKFLYITFTFQPGFTPVSPGPGGVTIFPVNTDGSLGDPVVTAAAGNTPFGFDYTTRGQVVVSEAGSATASSYETNADGSLSVVSAAAPTLQRAPCWLIVNNSGRFAYTANAGTSNITGFSIDAKGTLTRLAASGVTADLGAGAQPLDLDMSRNGDFLYVMKNGTGTVGGFAVNGDGSLTPLPDTPGLAARAGYMGLAAY